MQYGLPYQGSKNAIAEKIVSLFPAAENFYDLFAGGCAITHRAMIEGRWQNYYANDIDVIPSMFNSAVKGEFKNEKRWISREDFFRLKDNDLYVSICWSFGNDRSTYLYSKEIEPWKKALHYARVFGDCSELKKFGIDSNGSPADIRKNEEEYKEKYITWYVKTKMKSPIEYETIRKNLKEKIKRGEEELRNYLIEALKKANITQSEVNKRLGTQMSGHYFGRSQWAFPTREEYNKMRAFMPLEKDYDEIYGLQELYQSLESLQRLQRLQRLQSLQSLQSLESLQSLQRLQRLQSLQSLQRLERLEVTNASYERVKIKPNSVIYCDIPYEGTKGYVSGEFNHKKFYDWASEQTEPLFISSYEINDDRFEEVWSMGKMALFSQKNKKCIEKVFAPKEQRKKYPVTLFDLI